MDDKYITHTHILSTINLDENTTEALNACVIGIFRKHEAERDLNVFITDSVANMKAAFQSILGYAFQSNFGAVM